MPARFALATSLSPADVGARVVVRRRLPEGGLGDVLGELVGWDDGRLRVRRRDGQLVVVDAAAVVAGKRVPPTPARPARPRAAAGQAQTAGLAETKGLGQVAADGWPGVERTWIGGWLLQAAGGFTGRANSVQPLGDPGRPLDEALTTVRDWYAARGLPVLVSVAVGARLEAELAARGWRPARPGETVLVQTAPVASVLDRVGRVRDHSAGGSPTQPTPGEVATTFTAEPAPEWLAWYRGGEARTPVAREVLASPRGAVTFAGTWSGGQLVAGGRGVVLAGWVGLAAMEVEPGHRRRGLATATLAALVRHGRDQHARSAYLQVDAANDAAVGLYARLGFTTAYRYRYLRAP